MSYDERITIYFGDAVLRAGFMPVPHLLMRHYRALDLLTEHAMFAMQLMEISWDLAQPPTTMRKIAERMGISVRTAQRYSEYLAARGLIVIYEQFEHGAQVENGYDLAPLFRALAAFAPEPRPGGTPRERRKRGALQGASAVGSFFGAGPPDTGDVPPGDMAVIPPGDAGDTRGDDRVITPAPDPADTPRATRMTGLKLKQESPKKQQEAIGVNGTLFAGHTTATAPSIPQPPVAACSLRLGRELTAGEVQRSGQLLDLLGVHVPVARACAATLAPAEVLALAAYARAAGLSTGWLASQIYDFQRRRPRAADLARRWDEAGDRLAVLDDGTALQLLDAVDRHAPAAPGALTCEPCYLAGTEPARAAAAAVWALMHEVRGGAQTTRALPERPGGDVGQPGSVWSSVLARLRLQLAAPDYETWLQSARLLLLENDVAIIGTDNVFAREHLEQAHGELLAQAFSAERGRATRVDVVIG